MVRCSREALIAWEGSSGSRTGIWDQSVGMADGDDIAALLCHDMSENGSKMETERDWGGEMEMEMEMEAEMEWEVMQTT